MAEAHGARVLAPVFLAHPRRIEAIPLDLYKVVSVYREDEDLSGPSGTGEF